MAKDRHRPQFFLLSTIFSAALARAALAGIFVAVLAAPALAKFDQTHKVFSNDLKKYVDGKLVHYSRWKASPKPLGSYLRSLGAITPSEYGQFTENQKKALWINAYNAITIKLVVDHYPITGDKPYYPKNSLRQITNVWEDYKFPVAGRELSLYDIEHNVIRKDFKDPRMHFAVVCASRGCPVLRPTAYVATTLDKDLDEVTRQYLADNKNVQFDPAKNEVRVSKLFSWFPLDFMAASGVSKGAMPPPSDESIVLSYVLAGAPADVKDKFAGKDPHVAYMPFDWSLNDADEKASAPEGKPKAFDSKSKTGWCACIAPLSGDKF